MIILDQAVLGIVTTIASAEDWNVAESRQGALQCSWRCSDGLRYRTALCEVELVPQHHIAGEIYCLLDVKLPWAEVRSSWSIEHIAYKGMRP